MSSHAQALLRDEDSQFSSFLASYKELMGSQDKGRLSKTQETLLGKLETFSTLEEDWNGYEAGPIYSEAIENAFNFIMELSSSKEYRQLDIFPVPNRHVQIEMEQGDTYLEFEFREDSQVEIFFMENDEEKEFTRLLNQDCIDDMIRMVDTIENKGTLL